MKTTRILFQFTVWGLCFVLMAAVLPAWGQDYIWKLGGQHGIEHFERGKDYSEYEFPDSNLWNMGDIVDLKMDRVNFEGSRFGEMLIKNTSFRGANLRRVVAWELKEGMIGCDLTDADISDSTLPISKEQLISTKNYKEKNLAGCSFTTYQSKMGYTGIDLSGVSFAGFDLTNTAFYQCDLTDCDFTDATITDIAITGMTYNQLRSTKNFKTKKLSGMLFFQSNFDNADFRGFELGPFRDCSFKNANLTDALLIEYPEINNNRNHGFYQCSLDQKAFESTRNYQQDEIYGMTLSNMNLDGWNFRGKKLQAVNFEGSSLRNTDLTDAKITDVNFDNTNITKEQLQSTIEYKGKAKLFPPSTTGVDLSGWDFSDMTITSTFRNANLKNAKFTNTKFSNMGFIECDLTGADFTDVKFINVTFSKSPFTWEQFCTSQNGKEKNYSAFHFDYLTLHGWDFSDANLEDKKWYNCYYPECQFKNTKINTGSNTIGLNTDTNIVGYGMTAEQLKETANFKSKNFRDGTFFESDLNKIDFSGFDLTNTTFIYVSFSGVNFTDAIIDGVTFRDCFSLSNEQFDSTVSVKKKILKNVNFENMDLSGKNFSGMYLENCRFDHCNFIDANFENTRMKDVTFCSWQGDTDTKKILPKEQIKQTWNYKNREMETLTLYGIYEEQWRDLK